KPGRSENRGRAPRQTPSLPTAALQRSERESTPPESIATPRRHRQPPLCKHCAASARRRSCSFRSGGRFELRGWNNFFGERFETRIAAEWVEQRVNSDIS